MLKTLIINGSPRRTGDTDFLLTELTKRLRGEIIELVAYDSGIVPCTDCRACKVTKGCVIHDGMEAIYTDDFDNVVIASPLYISNLTAPLMAIASRFQAYYCAKRFLKDEFQLTKKKAALIIVGGGDGSPDEAIRTSAWMFKKMNAHGFERNTVLSLNTDDIPANQDAAAFKRVCEVAEFLNSD